jgi:hypothetical protein
MCYAGSSQGRARIEKARQELRDGKGNNFSLGYFDDLNRRIAERVVEKNRLDL